MTLSLFVAQLAWAQNPGFWLLVGSLVVVVIAMIVAIAQGRDGDSDRRRW